MTAPHTIPTAHGDFIAFYSAQGLVRLEFPDDPWKDRSQFTDLSPDESLLPLWHSQTELALHTLLSGKAPVQLPPLDISSGSEFQRAVWQLLLAIPFGHTRTYGDLAADLHSPNGGRAVGAACGANPIPVLIPCHRVTGAHGRLGGFSGGLPWKHRLLQIEGVLLA